MTSGEARAAFQDLYLEKSWRGIFEKGRQRHKGCPKATQQKEEEEWL